jgi:hypothetical protein
MGRSPPAVAETSMYSSVAMLLVTDANAASAASRPVTMRTMDWRGARSVASWADHRPSSSGPPNTAWKSIGYSPGAYTAANRAGMPTARQGATPRWAKSRQVPIPVSKVSSAESWTELEPAT